MPPTRAASASISSPTRQTQQLCAANCSALRRLSRGPTVQWTPQKRLLRTAMTCWVQCTLDRRRSRRLSAVAMEHHRSSCVRASLVVLRRRSVRSRCARVTAALAAVPFQAEGDGDDDTEVRAMVAAVEAASVAAAERQVAIASKALRFAATRLPLVSLSRAVLEAWSDAAHQEASLRRLAPELTKFTFGAWCRQALAEAAARAQLARELIPRAKRAARAGALLQLRTAVRLGLLKERRARLSRRQLRLRRLRDAFLGFERLSRAAALRRVASAFGARTLLGRALRTWRLDVRATSVEASRADKCFLATSVRRWCRISAARSTERARTCVEFQRRLAAGGYYKEYWPTLVWSTWRARASVYHAALETARAMACLGADAASVRALAAWCQVVAAR
ncbi:unnamed protein product, partial [Polarella glacialis]